MPAPVPIQGHVASVEPEEGPRLIGGIVGGGELEIERAPALHIEREAGLALPRFRPA